MSMLERWKKIRPVFLHCHFFQEWLVRKANEQGDEFDDWVWMTSERTLLEFLEEEYEMDLQQLEKERRALLKEHSERHEKNRDSKENG